MRSILLAMMKPQRTLTHKRGQRRSNPSSFYFGQTKPAGEAIGRPHFGQTKPAERDFYALGAWPCVASRAPIEGPPEENEMGRTFAAFVVAASLLAVASSEASAWVCFATGLGSSGRARSYDIIDAKLFALRRCERNSPVPICTLLWCRPGG
jgi:hypothetical protein